MRDINLQELLDEVLASLAPVADARQITVRIENAEGMTLSGERLLLHAHWPTCWPTPSISHHPTGGHALGEALTQSLRHLVPRPGVRHSRLRIGPDIREVLFTTPSRVGQEGNGVGLVLRQGNCGATSRPRRTAQSSAWRGSRDIDAARKTLLFHLIGHKARPGRSQTRPTRLLFLSFLVQTDLTGYNRSNLHGAVATHQ